MSTARRIRRFIRELVGDLGVDDPLAEGLIDSLEREELLALLEESFSIEFADEELSAERFESIEALASLVDSKRLGRATA